jgi:hypothetical protein
MKTLRPSPAWQHQVSSRQQLQQPGHDTAACASIAVSMAYIIMPPQSWLQVSFGRNRVLTPHTHCCHMQVGGLMPVLCVMLGSRLSFKRYDCCPFNFQVVRTLYTSSNRAFTLSAAA